MQVFLEPMARDGADPVGAMGSDTPIAVLSRKPRLLYNYFKQNFAQVTNPPIDPIREELVMSLVSMIGPRPNLLGHHAGTHYRLEVKQPILTNTDLEDAASPDRGKFSLLSWLSRYPGVAEWLRLKAALSTDIVRHWREIVTEAGGHDRQLCANAFMPPYSIVTGLDFHGVSPFCDAVSPKFYTMHWSMMER